MPPSRTSTGEHHRLVNEFCPDCGTPRVALFRYCRTCGVDFDALDQSGELPLGPYSAGGVETPGEPVAPGAVAPGIVASGRAVRPASPDDPPKLGRWLSIGLAGVSIIIIGVCSALLISGPREVPGSLRTGTPSASGSGVVTGGAGSSGASIQLPQTGGTLSPTPTATAVPTPGIPLEAYTSVQSIDVGTTIRTELRGHLAVYVWREVRFETATTSLRWDAWTASRTPCTVQWRIVPGRAGVERAAEIDVKGDSHRTGETVLQTPFVSASVVVTSTCPNWVLSMKGTTSP